MDFDLVIFDLDGTLLDTAPDIHNCVLETLNTMGLPPIHISETKKAIGPNHETFAKIVMGHSPSNNAAAFFHIFRPLYIKNCAVKTRPFPGIVNLLEELKDIKLAVATNKMLSLSQSILKQLDLLEMFELVVGPELVNKPKPEPDMVLYCAEKLDTVPAKTLLLGDTDNDILATNAAGAKSCLAGWGYSNHQEKLSSISDYCIKNPIDLLNIIKSKTFA
jgi:phosphoglycolate phosphatase